MSQATLSLIAHRGYPSKYPENTIVGYQAAIRAGARWIETDIQLTRDECPVLYHDVELQRISDCPGQIFDRSLCDLDGLRASCPRRFGERFSDEPIATLEQFVELLTEHPKTRAMVELKPQSIARFGVDAVLDIVHEHLCELTDRCVIISLDPEILGLGRTQYGWRVGWVLRTWGPADQRHAKRLQPEFLFGSTRLLSVTGKVTDGPWNWAIYSIDDPNQALAQSERGIAFVETDAIGEMLRDERLASLCRAETD